MLKDVCIPRIHNKIPKEYIYNVFCKLRIGKIQRITEIPLHNEQDFKRVFIKIHWNELSKNTKYIQDRFSTGENVKVVHDDSSNFWKIVKAE